MRCGRAMSIGFERIALRMTKVADVGDRPFGAAVASVSCSLPWMTRTPNVAANGAAMLCVRRQPSGSGARRAYQARVQPGKVCALALIQVVEAVRAVDADVCVRGSWQPRACAAATTVCSRF